MAAFFDNSVTGPQTHVLIIGVGGYPFLDGGTSRQQGVNVPFASLGQLTSAPISAAAFLEAVHEIGEQGAWLAPLGSVHALIGQPSGEPVTTRYGVAERPTLKSIQIAFDQWKTRSNQHEDNIAIFYFCGHGLQLVDQYLCAEDFMERPNSPGGRVFNVNATRRGLIHWAAQKKILFIDACRGANIDLIKREFTADGLDGQVYGDDPRSYSFMQHATMPGAAAWGRPGEVSVYTSALIRALRGQLAEKAPSNEWVIKTATLASKMNELIDMEESAGRDEQWCTHDYSKGWDIIRYLAPPDVEMDVSSDPKHLQSQTTYACYDFPHGVLVDRRDPAPSNWQFSLKAGIYSINAYTNDPAFAKVDAVVAVPPKTLHIVTLS